MAADPVMIVTGASRGIGAATVRAAARRGYRVVINYASSAAAANSLLDEVRELGSQGIAVQADVGSEKDVLRLFSAADEQYGQLDVLVNNAGILRTQCRLDELEADRLEEVFRVNITGSFLCAREAVKRMSVRYGGSGGVIVNVSSRAAVLGGAGEYVDYAASKGAIDAMTVGLAREVADVGIRVNAVRPGLIYTDIHESGGEPGRVERLKDGVPMKRGGEASEVAESILWLASDAASYCTGTFLDVSGGR